MKKLSTHISTFLPVYITIAAVMAYMLPDLFFLLMDRTNFLLGAVLFITGLSMSVKDLAVLKKASFPLMTGLLLKWTITVLLSVLLAIVFFSEMPAIASGLILTGSVPSGTAATLYTFLAGGNTSLMVTMGTVDVFLSPFLTPVIMELFADQHVVIPFFNLVRKMFFIVIVPIGLGMTVHYFFHQSIQQIKTYTKLASSLTILAIVLGVVANVASKMTVDMGLLMGLFAVVFIQVLVPMLLGYRLSLLLGISRYTAIAILFEVGLCNSALAAILAMEFFGELAAVPAVINMIINLSLGAFFSRQIANNASARSV
ncbi:bile acid:sodium symporter family protein [Lentibacillus lipolyticus]|nr:bile acid:sodium symporter family protein [Lentibacillus lipolyticus]